MAKSKLGKANEKIAEKVVGAYQKIEDTVVGEYKRVETGFVNAFLTEKKPGEAEAPVAQAQAPDGEQKEETV